jgi:hypothetical protein|uniref:Pyocin activator protein PrtN n=1 Tax=Caudovirales sp. ct1Jx6 TaxID=2826765 RepID=A0A8S5ML39_9CAUD|nr:MAG TPA: Pyocin activator protein PrtN [Caudovirales sp. ct1Jx6]
MTDAEILSLKRVTPQVAARYLGISDDTLRDGLRDGTFSFGTASRSAKSGKWIYDIRPVALVNYNNNGRLPTNVEALAETIAAKIVRKLNGGGAE